MIKPDDYCTLCGTSEQGDGVHVEEPLDSWLCERCCNHVADEYLDHAQYTDYLDFPDWFKLAFPSRVIVVDDDVYMTIHRAAAVEGLTPEEFLSKVLTELLEQLRNGESL